MYWMCSSGIRAMCPSLWTYKETFPRADSGRGEILLKNFVKKEEI